MNGAVSGCRRARRVAPASRPIVSLAVLLGVALACLCPRLTAQPPPRPAPATPQRPGQPIPRPTPYTLATTYTGTVPAPVQLVPSPTRIRRFTITGTRLGNVVGVRLVNSRAPVWILPATVERRWQDSLHVAAKVPTRFLALGPYAILAGRVGGELSGTGLTAQADEVKPIAVWSEFEPELHGFRFANVSSYFGRICFRIDGGALVYDPSSSLCDDDWGLCGGMSLIAGERYRAARFGTHDLDSATAKADLVNGQFRTLDGPTVAKFLEWIYSPDEGHLLNPLHSVGHRMQEDWNDHIRPELDAYRPVVVGLIFDKRAEVLQQVNPLNVGLVVKQHQVLAIGFTREGASTVRLAAYDPNIPDDILILTFTTPSTGVTQELASGRSLPPDRRAVRGVMFVRTVP